jgi:hypothetical protein
MKERAHGYLSEDSCEERAIKMTCFHHWIYISEYSKTWNLHRCSKCGKERTVNKKHDGNVE